MTETGAPLPRWQQSVPVWLSAVYQIATVACLLSFVMEPQWTAQYHVLAQPFQAISIPVAGSVFTSALYAVLALAAIRRKRLAVWVTVWLFQAPSVLFFILTLVAQWYGPGSIPKEALQRIAPRPTDLLSVILAIAIIAILVSARHAFPARVERGAWWRALLTLAAGWLVSFAVAFIVSILVPGTLRGPRGRLRWSISAALGDVPDRMLRGGEGPAWLATVCATLSVLAVIVAIWVFTRSARSAREMSASDELQVRALLATTPDVDSLGYFATRREKSVIFSRSGGAAISFRVLGGVCMAGGDPIGERASWPDAVGQFIAHARTFGWTVGVLAASPEAAEVYRRAGLRVFQLGDEAVVDTEEFDLRHPDMREVLSEVRRVERLGYTVSVRRQSDIPDAELAALDAAAAHWRHGESERGFSMALGRLGDRADDSMVVVTAADSGGEVRGLLTFVPWGTRGLSLDLMRRSPLAAAGTTTFLIAGLLRAAPDFGVSQVSLNFAMLRHIFDQGDQLGAGPIDRLMLRIVRLASRKWQLESLYKYNERFRPRWSPRLLCYDRGSNLAYIAVTAARLEGFLPAGRARLSRRARGRRSDPRTNAHPSVAGFAAQVRHQEAELWQQALRHAEGARRPLPRQLVLDRLRAAGMDPYPVAVPRDTAIHTIVSRYGTLEADAVTQDRYSVVARVLSTRNHGGVVFATVREDASQLQVMATRGTTQEYQLWCDCVQRGDLISVTGPVIATHTGELTLLAQEWTMAAKCLRPAPSKRHGVEGAEAAVRERHLALAYSAEARTVLESRSRIVAHMRAELGDRGFLEVSTPMLQTVHGGANARPFRTYAEAYGVELSLRIAPELALKKLCVGGFERIFEMGRNFRNEGADATHNPEFTSLEAYQAFADYRTMEELARTMIQRAAIAVHGQCQARSPGGEMMDISGTWNVVEVHHAVSHAVGRSVEPGTPVGELHSIAAQAGVPVDPRADCGEVVSALYDKLVEPQTTAPTFYTRFPRSTSPLTKADPRDPRLVERWDLVANGMELGTAYSELNDPVDQRERLTVQSLLAARGDPEAMEVDESFLRALEFGMPPTGGLGLGVDRIVMFLLGLNIRQTLAFPFVRPEGRP